MPLPTNTDADQKAIQDIVADLNRAKCHFQLRAICAVLDIAPPSPDAPELLTPVQAAD